MLFFGFVLKKLLCYQQTNADGQGDVTRMAENFETNVGRRSREEEHESRSGSDNMDGGSGDDQDAADNTNPRKKKRYHRHTPQQIQELEAYDIIKIPYFILLFLHKIIDFFSVWLLICVFFLIIWVWF